MFGTLVLVFGALCCLMLPWGSKDLAAASIVVGFIVWGLVTSMGGPTGPGLNPARDLMPRLLHAILPIPNKGTSRWERRGFRSSLRLWAPSSARGCTCSSSRDFCANRVSRGGLA